MTAPLAVFRADASLEVGTGHVVRSRTLACALLARSWRVTFVARDLPPVLAEALGTDGMVIAPLPPQSSVESEPETIAAMVGPDVDLVVGDHYGLDAVWFAGMRQRMPRAVLLSIDDQAFRPSPVDLILNQNLGIAAASYAALVPASTRILAGPRYALLRPEFASMRATGRLRQGRVDRLLVFISGADAPNVTTRAVEGLHGLDLPVDIVVGAAYPHLESLNAAVTRHAITIHVNTDEMATLMARADLAVGAPSSASWERCTLGLPTILITMADNQVSIARALVEAGAAVSAGWHTTVSAAEIERTVRALCADPQRVNAMSMAAAAVTDGRGTDRVVAEIEFDAVSASGRRMSQSAGAVRLRPITVEDKAMVLGWRNRPDVAAFMFTDHRITRAEHDTWFASAMDDGTRRYWIIEFDGLPVGLADLTEISYVHKRASVGLYIAEPRVRGRGVGAAADRLIIRYAFAELGLDKLSAEVLTTNELGMKVHLHHGFHLDGILRQHVIKTHRRVDVATLSLLRTEWSDSEARTGGRARPVR